jgi:hypothetical protein
MTYNSSPHPVAKVGLATNTACAAHDGFAVADRRVKRDLIKKPSLNIYLRIQAPAPPM